MLYAPSKECESLCLTIALLVCGYSVVRLVILTLILKNSIENDDFLEIGTIKRCVIISVIRVIYLKIVYPASNIIYKSELFVAPQATQYLVISIKMDYKAILGECYL